jgi:hypothetical protein
LGSLNGQAAQQQPIEKGKHHGIGPDSGGQRENRGKTKDRVLPQCADSQEEIPIAAFQHGEQFLILDPFGHRAGASELEPRAPVCLLR